MTGIGTAHTVASAGAHLRRLLLSTTVLTAAALTVTPAAAQNATWNLNPGNNNYTVASNWTPATVPTGTASFGLSNTTSLEFASGFALDLLVGSFNFSANAPAYTFTHTSDDLFFTGVGIVNNSAFAPTFNVGNRRILEFTNASTAANANIVAFGSAGRVQFRGTSTAAGSTITLGDIGFGLLSFFDNSTAANATINNLIGTIVFSNNSTAGSADITIGQGGISFIDSSNAGNATIAITSTGGLIAFANASLGTSTITNAGSVNIFGNATADTATIINNAGGTVDVSADVGAPPSIGIGSLSGAGNVFLGARTLILGGLNLSETISGVIADGGERGGTGGALTKIGLGTLTLSGHSTYTGATNIDAGTLRTGIANALPTQTAVTVAAGAFFDLNGFNQSIGSLAGAGNTTLGAATLTTGSNNTSTTFSGALSGNGGVTKVGTGTWMLSGVNAYLGATTVNAGTLLVNGAIVTSSSVTVNSGATLGGIGTLPNTVINAGGNLSPGNSIGTITIVGNVSFVGAGNYIVEVSPTNADRTNATTANLGGTLNAVSTGGTYTIGTRYTVLNTTGGVTGTFSNLAVTGSFGTARPVIEYDANNVYLVLLQGSISPFLFNGTPNQVATAGAIDAALLAGNTSPLFQSLFSLTGTQLNVALDRLSGEVHASTLGVLADESLHVRSAILGRLRTASYGGTMGAMAALTVGGPQMAFADPQMESALTYAKSPIPVKAPLRAPAPTRDVVFWAQGFGSWARFETDGNAATVRRDLAGFVTGLDTSIGPGGRIGIAAGYTASKNALEGRGTANVETAHVAAYGGWRFGAINLRAGGSYALHTIDTDRTIVFPGFADRATARYDGDTAQVFGEVGYGVNLGSIAFEPFAGAAWVRVSTDAAAERANVAGLNIAAASFDVGYSTLGVRAASVIPLGTDTALIPRGSLAWQHAFDGVTAARTHAFQAAPVPFVISGVPIARDALLAEAGLDLAIGRSITLGLSYVGQIAETVQDHAAKGKFAVRF